MLGFLTFAGTPVSPSRRRNAKAFDRRPGDRRCTSSGQRGCRHERLQGPHREHDREGQGLEGPPDSRPVSSSASRSRTATSTKRATVIEQYAIGSEGLVTNPKKFPKCAFTDLDDATVPAEVQQGARRRGSREERCRSEQHAGPGRAAALGRQHAVQPAAAALQRRRRHDAAARQQRQAASRRTSSPTRSAARFRSHTAINGKFVNRKIGGVDVERLRVQRAAEPEAPASGHRQLGARARTT